MPQDLTRIRGNISSMIDQHASEAEIDSYITSEGVTTEDLGGRLTPASERAYASMAADPKSTADDLMKFASDRGRRVTKEEADGFIAARNSGSRVSKQVVYRGLTGAPKPSLAQNVGGFVGTAVDAVLPGAARFDRGVQGAAKNALSSVIGSDEFDPAGSFQQGQDEQDFAQSRFGVEHPALSNTATATGMAASLALPESRLFRGSGMAAGIGNAALTSGAYGMASGALNDSGEGRMANMLAGGAGGLVIGGASVPALRGASQVGSAALRNIPGADATARFLQNVPRRALRRPLVEPGASAAAQSERLLGQAMEDSTIETGMGTGSVQATPSNVAAEVARRQALGIPAMPADVSQPLRRASAIALAGDGPMVTRARNMTMQRQAAQGSRVRGHVTDELGQAIDPIQAGRDINARAAAASGPGYQAAYAQPMVLTPEIEGIMRTPAFQDALPNALRNIRNAQRNPTELGFRMDADGAITGTHTLTVEGFDQVIRAMKESGEAAMDRTGFQPRDTSNSVHINNRVRDLRGHLGDQNPAYADVTANYADEMATRRAMEDGGDVSKLTGHEINSQMADMPQHAQEAWMSGARSALADEATQAGLKPTANVAQRTRQSLGMSGGGGFAAAGDQAKQRAIEAMSGRPGVMNRLDDRLEGEDQAFKTFREVSRGGTAGPPGSEALDGIGTMAVPAIKLALGHVKGALADVMLGGPRGTAGYRRAVDERTAGILTAIDPQDMQDGMDAIAARATTDAAWRAGLHSRASQAARVGGVFAAAQPGDPYPGTPQEGTPEALALPRYTSGGPFQR